MGEPGGHAPMRVPVTAGRRRNMQANRRRDTGPELAIRRALYAAGYRYRVDYRIDLPDARVRPDIAFTNRRLAIFVDGCFWHACPEHGRSPGTNTEYWTPKLQRNVERDAHNTESLRAGGWSVLRFWEHENVADALVKIADALGNGPLHPPARQVIDVASERQGTVSEAAGMVEQ